MIADSALRWITTVLFVFAGGYCAYRVVQPGPVLTRIDHGLHLVMCVAMIAMAWPQGLGVPAIPQAVFFSAATLWFLAIAVWTSGSGHHHQEGHQHSAIICGYHALMMAAMVWMVALMAGWLPGSTAHEHAGGESGMDMPGMDMPGMDMGSGHTGHAAAVTDTTPVWISAITSVLAVGFALAAVAWLYRFFVHQQQVAASQPARIGVGSSAGNSSAPLPSGTLLSAALACNIAMAAGMAIMSAVMV